VIGLHIAKTGGTTILNNVHDHLDPDELYSHGRYSNIRRFFAGERLLFEEGSPASDRIRFVFGHGVDQNTLSYFPDRPFCLFCVVRDPFSHAVSQYKHMVRIRGLDPKQSDFAKFYTNRQTDIISRQLTRLYSDFVDPMAESLVDKAVSVLRHFRFVLSTNRLDEQSRHLYRYIGVPTDPERKRVYPEQVDLNGITEDQILADNPADCELNRIVVAHDAGRESAGSADVFSPFGYDADTTRDKVRSVIDSQGGTHIEEDIEKFIRQLSIEAKLEAAKSFIRAENRDGLLSERILNTPTDEKNARLAAESYRNDAEYNLRAGNNVRAIELYKKAVLLDDANAQAWLGLGRAYRRMADYPSAIDSANRALEIVPGLKGADKLKSSSTRLLRRQKRES